MPKRKPTKRVSKKKKKSYSLKWISFLLILLFGATIWCWYQYRSDSKELKAATPAQFTKNIPNGYKSVGIDVSHHQGIINWEELF